MSIEKVTLSDKFSMFDEYWAPRIVGELNGQHVKIAKLQGQFEWHQHEAEDELFLVIDGTLRVELREQTVVLEQNEFVIIPRGVEHKPVADEEVKVLLFEPKSTINTGNVESELTVEDLEDLS